VAATTIRPLAPGRLLNNISGENTANGAFALAGNTTGELNTATGFEALVSSTQGYYNTANGGDALFSNTTGTLNTAIGAGALSSNTIGFSNTANGASALYYNTTGVHNTAAGNGSLYKNTIGSGNTAIGDNALSANTTGTNNTAIGASALSNNYAGSNNIALGSGAGANVTAGNFNVYIGAGVPGVADDVGHTYISNISSTVQPPGGDVEYVTIDLNTKLLGHSSSSWRYKVDIKPMANASEALYQLKPATYRYKKEIDKRQSAAFGLIAEEVANLSPDLVAYDAKGRPKSVHYEMVNAMLLNEFLKEHRHVQEQDAIIARQQKQIDALSAGLQKVSAQLELSKLAAQVVANP
jgi:Chaperone of endosialidase